MKFQIQIKNDNLHQSLSLKQRFFVLFILVNIARGSTTGTQS